MLTLALKIKSVSNSEILNNYISEYTNMFYNLYKHPEKHNDKDYIDFILKNFILDKSMFDFCLSDVKTKLKQRETSIKKKQDKILEIESFLKNNTFKTKKEKKVKYKLINKLAFIKRTLYNNSTFGGKALLREITKLSQNKNKTDEQVCSLISKKELFKEKRKLPLYLIGRACNRGNRKIDFDLENNKIIFKPNRETKIEIEFYLNNKNSKKLRKTLDKIQSYVNANLIPITVRLSKDTIYLSYDEEFLNGFSFNENECKKEQSQYSDKEIRKQIYIKYKEEQNDKKKQAKLVNRYCSVDLNPNFIGFTIFDYNEKEDKVKNIILTECIDLRKLNQKTGLSSDDSKQKSKNNKRKHEIRESWKYIFNKCIHYKVYNFVMEDLEFKDKSKDSIKLNKESNRQIKNLWHRTLTTNLINKYCNTIGINKIEVQAAYSSFIGNMVHPYFDPIASAMEIGRRGIYKYKKGYSIYPSLDSINQERLDYLLGENVLNDGTTWKELYKIISLLRYRNPAKAGLIDNYLSNTRKSKVILIRE